MDQTSEWTLRNRRRRSIWKPLGIGLLVIVLLLATAIVTVGWVASERALGPSFRDSEWSLADFPDLQPETVSFESQTGVELQGRFFEGEHDASIILLHGFSEGQDQMLPHAEILVGEGFNVLTFDGRHPDRYGDRVFSTLGALERYDLVSAVDYLAERPETDPERIGVYGASLGGATAILGGALDPRINAIAAEGAFSDGDNVIDSSFERYIGLPSFPFGQVTKWIAERRAGASLDDARPMGAITLIEDRPVLLIHGLEDDAVPPDHTERNRDAGGENVAVWWVDGAHHFDAFQITPDEYVERLGTFFDEALR
jgi:uncharacterized protein